MLMPCSPSRSSSASAASTIASRVRGRRSPRSSPRRRHHGGSGTAVIAAEILGPPSLPGRFGDGRHCRGRSGTAVIAAEVVGPPSLTRTVYWCRTPFEMTRTPFENAIEARGLVKTYGDVRALDGLDLDVEAGTVFGLLGPNGAGKSTTVRILTTLSRPDAGQARVAGLDVLAEPVRVRHAIGVVGQKHGVDPDATGRENLVIQGEI